MNLIERFRGATRRRARPHIPRDDNWMRDDPPWRPPHYDDFKPQYAPKDANPAEELMARDYQTADEAHHEFEELERLTARKRPSLETPIEPFQAPELSERIPQAYRMLAEEVVVAVSAMILRAEEARIKAVEFLQHCDRQAAWHTDFIHNYIAHETATAEAYSAQWQQAIDALTAKRAAVQALTSPVKEETKP